MRSNYQETKIVKKVANFVVGMIALAVLLSTISVLHHYDRLQFFEKRTGVSLAPLEKIKVFGNDRFTGSGWVEVTGQLPHSEINRFIADNNFFQFDVRYSGTFSSNWSEREYELWVLQGRVFGIPPLRYRRFSTVSKIDKETLPPECDDYFLLKKGKEGPEWYIILDKRTGTFFGRVFY